MSDTLSPIADLPLKHQRFIVEYLQDYNATQAAIRSGYRPKAAQEQGCRLLSKLKHYIEPVGRKHVQKRLMKAEDVIDGLVKIASSDFRDFASWDGKTLNVKSSDELTPEQAFCIESITQTETQHAKYLTVKLHSKVKALDYLAKHHNLFKQVMATKGLMVVYQRPQAQAIPEGARIVEGEVIEGKWKTVPRKIEFKRPGISPGPNGSSGTPSQKGTTNGHGGNGSNGGNGHSANGSAKNGLHSGPTTHDQGTA